MRSLSVVEDGNTLVADNQAGTVYGGEWGGHW